MGILRYKLSALLFRLAEKINPCDITVRVIFNASNKK